MLVSSEIPGLRRFLTGSSVIRLHPGALIGIGAREHVQNVYQTTEFLYKDSSYKNKSHYMPRSIMSTTTSTVASIVFLRQLSQRLSRATSSAVGRKSS